MPRTRSLRTQLTLRLVAPLTALICISAAISYFVAMHFANLAYDHWLLDSTHSLAQAVKFEAGTISVEPPPTALEIFQWDAEDKTYFKIESYGVGLLAGYEDIPGRLIRTSELRNPHFITRACAEIWCAWLPCSCSRPAPPTASWCRSPKP
jgi:two-component system sensor histidine kinase TctE